MLGTLLAAACPPASQAGLRQDEIRAAYRQLTGLLPPSLLPSPGEPTKCGLPGFGYLVAHRLNPGLLKALQTRPTLQKSILSGNFRIHYDTTGTDAAALLDASFQPIPGTADAFADSVAASANHVYRVEVDSLDYLPPPGDGTAGGGPEYDIYVMNLGSADYGETVPEQQIDAKTSGGRFITFLEIHNTFNFVVPDSNKGIRGMHVTLAHEFHHAIQLGSYGWWSDEQYYYEITSTWMEDVVYPEVKDYLQYLRSSGGQFRRPQVPFTAQDNIWYSRAIWDHYVARRFGRDAVRASWNLVASERPLAAINDMLGVVSSSFRKAFSEWSLWNYYTGSRSDVAKYYPEGPLYPEMIQSAVEFDPPFRVIADSLPPLASRYHGVAAANGVVTLIADNVNFAAALDGVSQEFPYSYYLSSTRPDVGYDPTGAGIYVKLDAVDRTNWWSWEISGSALSGGALADGTPFPNPFNPAGGGTVSLPVTAQVPLQGTLSIYTNSMHLVYRGSLASLPQGSDRQVFQWDGRTADGEIAKTGIYVFVLELPGRTLSGKLALVRK